MASHKEIELDVLTTVEATVSSETLHDATDTNFAKDVQDTSTFDENELASSPPKDRGKDALLFLLAAFLVETLVWGFPFGYGIFQEYYSSHAPIAGSHNIAVIGVCTSGLMYLSSPLVIGVMVRFPRVRQPAVRIGLLIMCLSLGLSSFSQNVTHLIVSQGISYAIGGALVYCPTIMFVDEWYVKNKGLAYGTMWAGSGLGGVLVPLVLQWLLNAYGFRTTLRAWSVALFVLTVPVSMYVKPRVPVAQTPTAQPLDLTFLRDPAFLILQAGNILEGLGFFVPSIYLPLCAKSIGASTVVSTLPVILFNLTTVFGCIAMGNLTDRWHVTTCILLSTIGSTLSVFFIWGFSTSIPPLLVFSILYGFFAGSFSSTYPGIMKAMKKTNKSTNELMVFASLFAGRGIGNVLCGPVSEALVRSGYAGTIGLYATEYGPLVLFTGASAALGGVGTAARRFGWV